MTDSGHGHVFRVSSGHKARCGGPGLCRDCDADLDRLAATGDHAPIANRFRAELAEELQATFNRAREAT